MGSGICVVGEKRKNEHDSVGASSEARQAQENGLVDARRIIEMRNHTKERKAEGGGPQVAGDVDERVSNLEKLLYLHGAREELSLDHIT